MANADGHPYDMRFDLDVRDADVTACTCHILEHGPSMVGADLVYEELVNERGRAVVECATRNMVRIILRKQEQLRAEGHTPVISPMMAAMIAKGDELEAEGNPEIEVDEENGLCYIPSLRQEFS